MSLAQAEIWLKTGTEIVAVAAAVFAYFQFRSNVRTRRAEWLLSLYERFYERSTFHEIRKILDSPPRPSLEYQRLESDIESGTDGPHVEALNNYLNFFEFVAALQKRGALSQGEILDLFDYYLRNLRRTSFLLRYIRAQGFEGLTRLLDALEGSR